MNRLERRLAALEAVTRTGEGCPHRVYSWCVAHGLTAPEPSQGESLLNWLERVPTDSLESMIEGRRNDSLE